MKFKIDFIIKVDTGTINFRNNAKPDLKEGRNGNTRQDIVIDFEKLLLWIETFLFFLIFLDIS
ncbi:MAG: hypothetical protein P4L27_02900 [Ignavibacteriaceae bacterium]|nr:hypothetical protein [Ignavibacteriaceae bacterium]